MEMETVFDLLNAAWVLVGLVMTAGILAVVVIVGAAIGADVFETLDDFGIVVHWRGLAHALRKTANLIRKEMRT